MVTPKYIDTHAHLFSSDYSNDLDEVLSKSKNSGVEFIIVPATNLISSRETIQLSEKYKNIYACIGIHPHEGGKVTESDLLELDEICKNPKVVAIGEIGLDYHYDFCPHDKQKEIFSAQIEIAVQRNMPIVVHTRESIEDAFMIVQDTVSKYPNWKNSEAVPKKGVFHCFPGTASEAEYLNKLGFYVSFPGIVTFKKSDRIDVIKQIGLKNILLETDSPYMSPEPLRGKRNEPANIVYIGRKVAEAFGISEIDVARITSENAIGLFGLK